MAEGKVLLQKRPDTASNFPGFWTLPGGHIDEKEDALTAIMREVKEETGIIVSPDQVKLKISSVNYHSDKKQVWVIFGFRVDLDIATPPLSTDEGECRWYKVEEIEALNNLFPPIAIYINHIMKDSPSLLYMSGTWKNAKLVKQHTRIVDVDS